MGAAPRQTTVDAAISPNPAVEAAWARSATPLAAWAKRFMVNRRDAYISYKPLERRKDGPKVITVKLDATNAILAKHFRGESSGDLVSLHAIGIDQADGEGEVAACWSRWTAIDIDRHDDKIDASTTLRAAVGFHDELVRLGFRPLLMDSDGQGGFHLLIIFDAPIPTRDAYLFGKWIARGWRATGLEVEPETFPRQAKIEPKGFGAGLRLPGRHHTRPHWTRVWDGSKWLEGNAAIKVITGRHGDPASLIPADALVVHEVSRVSRSYIGLPDKQRDFELASAALQFLDPSVSNDEWVKIGMCLKSLGSDGLALFDNWSAKCPEKYRQGECDVRWRTFTEDGVTLGTLFKMAIEKGFTFPKDESRQLPRVAPGTQPHASPVDRDDEPDDDTSHVVDRWPVIDPAAFHGILGDITRLADPHTEADPIAVLVQIMVAFANAVARNPYWVAGATRHHLVLFAALVGSTAGGRKGSSWDVARRIISGLDEDWVNTRVTGGLSSGEGLIYHVRDKVVKLDDNKKEITVDEGVKDKRLLLIESELGRMLKAMTRETNTLSAVLRQCWDCAPSLATLTKNSTNHATQPHVSLIGHITSEELHSLLNSTESANGFGNRFIWICTRRSKFLPDGGDFDSVNWEPINRRLGLAFESARRVQRMTRDENASRAWRAVYSELSGGKPGLLGAMLARAEAQVMRIACIYALLDQSAVVRAEHLTAALALWQYAEDSAKFVFGESLSDPAAEKVLSALQATPTGLKRSEIIANIFQKNIDKTKLDQIFAYLLGLGLVHRTTSENTRGRKAQIWFAGRSKSST
jgi:Primase C terminal 2 (PriCT-2)/Protein of unknown function (DUF3987)